jgi:hypothetical protein
LRMIPASLRQLNERKRAMTLTPEKFAEITAKVEARMKRVKPPAKPKVVVSDGDVVRDAKVRVSVDDFNAHNRGQTEVEVRRPDPEWLRPASGLRPGTVKLNTAEADRQYLERQATATQDRHQRQQLREADPMNVWNTKGDY